MSDAAPVWLFSRSLNRFVRVLSRTELWGQRQVQAWDVSTSQLVTLPESDLAGAGEGDMRLVEHTLTGVAAACINEALASNLLVAPMDAGVVPLPHQIRALAKATGGERVRYLLADEVGLGKTIEAGLILRELKLRGLVRRALGSEPVAIH